MFRNIQLDLLTNIKLNYIGKHMNENNQIPKIKLKQNI